jgi:hypothetical protein
MLLGPYLDPAQKAHLDALAGAYAADQPGRG